MVSTLIDPTALQEARLALAALAGVWPLLAVAADTTLTRRAAATGSFRPEPAAHCRQHTGDEDAAAQCHRCDIARRSHDRWQHARDDRAAELRAEREDREHTERYRALASTRPPADLTIVAVRSTVLQEVHTSLLLVRSDLAPWLGRRGVTLAPPPRRVTARTFAAAVGWLGDVLDHTGGSTAAAVAGQLRPVGKRALQVLGLDVETGWQPMGTARCPACRQRALYRWTGGTDRRAWTRDCHNPQCRCTGPTCPCGRPGARPGSRHLWPAL